jgi:hypothetical protein
MRVSAAIYFSQMQLQYCSTAVRVSVWLCRHSARLCQFDPVKFSCQIHTQLFSFFVLLEITFLRRSRFTYFWSLLLTYLHSNPLLTLFLQAAVTA